MKLRLDKYLADMGLGTRSEVKKGDYKGPDGSERRGCKKAGVQSGHGDG